MLAWLDGVAKAGSGERLVELGEGHARLDHRHLVGDIEIEDGRHLVEADEDASIDRDRRTRESSSRSSGDDRCAVVSRCGDDLNHLGRRARPHDAHRTA